MEVREDGDTWIVGPTDTGDFVTAPAMAGRAVELLEAGRTVRQVQAALRSEFGVEYDIGRFVADLVDLGLVARLDGRDLGERPAPLPPTLGWLHEGHVRWLLNPATGPVAGAIVLIALGALAMNPALFPKRSDLIWSQSGAMVILGNAAIGWALIFLHEFAHLATARAAGVGGQMSLGTRLQFLVAQTDVTGVWARAQGTRVKVYLAGILFDLVVCSSCVLFLAIFQPVGITAELARAIALLVVISLPLQFLVFMRTDIYFLLQDLCKCANLYYDGASYLRYLTVRLRHTLKMTSRKLVDPTGPLTGRERRAVRVYAAFQIFGTAACLAMAIFITIPVLTSLVVQAVYDISVGSTVERLDGITFVVFVGAMQVLWARAWWRRHRNHVVRRELGASP